MPAAPAPPRPGRPSPLVRFLPGWVAGRRRPAAKGVHLTFDDGPHPEFTPAVLDRLAAYRVTATFFLIGARAAAHPGTARAVAAAGHHVGCHSFAHARPPALGFRQCLADLRASAAAIAGACGRAPAAFRPPFGRLTPGWAWAAWRSRVPVALWSLDGNDWRCRSAADAAAAGAAVAAAASAGDVVLLHDAHPWAAAVLDAALPVLAARGLI